MGSLQLSSYSLAASHSLPHNFNYTTNTHKSLKFSKHASFSRSRSRSRIRATATLPESDSQSNEEQEPAVVNFAFVHVSLI